MEAYQRQNLIQNKLWILMQFTNTRKDGENLRKTCSHVSWLAGNSNCRPLRLFAYSTDCKRNLLEVLHAYILPTFHHHSCSNISSVWGVVFIILVSPRSECCWSEASCSFKGRLEAKCEISTTHRDYKRSLFIFNHCWNEFFWVVM